MATSCRTNLFFWPFFSDALNSLLYIEKAEKALPSLVYSLEGPRQRIGFRDGGLINIKASKLERRQLFFLLFAVLRSYSSEERAPSPPSLPLLPLLFEPLHSLFFVRYVNALVVSSEELDAKHQKVRQVQRVFAST